MDLAFSITGLPVPQGSKRVVRGHLIEANATKLRPWRADMRAAAAEAMDTDPPAQGPLRHGPERGPSQGHRPGVGGRAPGRGQARTGPTRRPHGGGLPR